MDAIKSVENEVDKILRLLSDCRETCSNNINQLIDNVNKAKQELNNQTISPNQTELSGLQINLIKNICDAVDESCAEISDSHRKLHTPVSKVGKTIDKNFYANFACASDTSLFQNPENKKLLNHAIVQHLLRHGMANIAETLVKEANISIDEEELVKFDEIDAILNSLRQKDSGPALRWAIKHRKRLRELNSPLEFKIHRVSIIDLYKQGMEKQLEIIQYVQKAREQLDPMYEQDITPFLGALMYLQSGLENSPYKYFLDPINYDEIEDIFMSNACSLLNVSIRSPISVAVEAGCVALPSLLNINQKLSDRGIQNIWLLRDELPVEIDLGRKMQFHSTFSCPILKQQSTEINPPMRLVCGHVISRDALHKLSGNNNTNKLKCPYCPMEQVVSDAMQIHF